MPRLPVPHGLRGGIPARQGRVSAHLERCQRAFAPSDRETPGRRRVLLDALGDLWDRLEAMRADITRSPAAPDIREILDRPVLRTLYTETLNDLSLVFHNVRTGGAATRTS